jgi:hypothetical protein
MNDETLLSLTGMDVVNIIRAMSHRKEPSDKISQVYFRLVSALNGDLDPESQAAAEKILSGVEANERNLSQQIRYWVDDLKSGWFTVTQCDRELSIVTTADKTSRRQILHRLCDKGVVKRDKSRTESYQVLHRDERIMDPDGISLDTVDVVMPLGLSRKTKLFHGAVVVVAGVTGMGKTMFALNFIQDNMAKYEIYYLNSEMSDQELKFKKLAFKTFPYSGWTFTAVDVQGAMSESIRTDKINVIDYLQGPSDKPYLIRDLIDSIKKKLGMGMALILIQKHPQKELGEGGIFSEHASSMYISLSFGIAEVIKNRFREADEFRGLEKRNFEIKHGVLCATSGWYSAGAPEEKQVKTLKNKYAGLVHEREPGEDD